MVTFAMCAPHRSCPHHLPVNAPSWLEAGSSWPPWVLPLRCAAWRIFTDEDRMSPGSCSENIAMTSVPLWGP